MRVTTYAWGFAASLGATLVWFAGCGGTVAENSSTGGQTTTTSTGTTVSSSTSSSSSSTSTSSSSSGTTTGTSPCDMACAHIQMCTGFTCMQAGIDCATVGSSYDCVANCASAVPCAQLGVGTLQMCQAMCSDGGAGDAGPMDGGGALACAQCAGQKCGSVAGPCAQDMSTGGCFAWLQCVGACGQANPVQPSCFAACDAMYPNAQPKYDPVYSCLCTSCSTECAAEDPCAHGMDGGP